MGRMDALLHDIAIPVVRIVVGIVRIIPVVIVTDATDEEASMVMVEPVVEAAVAELAAGKSAARNCRDARCKCRRRPREAGAEVSAANASRDEVSTASASCREAAGAKAAATEGRAAATTTHATAASATVATTSATAAVACQGHVRRQRDNCSCRTQRDH